METKHETIAATRIFSSISAELSRTRRVIDAQLAVIDSVALERFTDLTHRSVHHLFRARGKHLRPTLVHLTALASSECASARRDALAQVAAAVELIHSASLVHDDVIDEADERRNNRSLNAQEGNKTAVLTGDLLYDQAFALLAGLKELGHDRQIELIELVTATTRQMCLGEIYEDRVAGGGEHVSFDDYVKVIEYKTASLMACSCAAAAIVLELPEEPRAVMTGYGHHLGVSYQLIDDVNDRDSVYYDDEVMVERAVEEAAKARDALGILRPTPYRERLADMPDLLLNRAERTLARTLHTT